MTDERLYPAHKVIAPLGRFSVTAGNPHYALTTRFLSAMLRLFHPQIAAALHARDRSMHARGKATVRDFTEDRSLPVVASVPLDLDAHLAALDGA